MRTFTKLVKIIAVIASIAAAFTLIISYITYRFAFFNSNRVPDDPHRIPNGPKYDCLKDEIHELIDSTLAIPYERVSIRSRDGLKLSAKFYRTAPGNRVAILMHGWHGIAERDFAGGVQAHLEKGDNVLLVDERAHNRSEGHTITFGVKERYDCLDWIEYVQRTFGGDTPIVLHGVSMGAAVVMMAADLGLPENVKGIIADSGYTSPKAIICKVVKDRKINPRIAWPFLKTGARLFGHFDPEDADTTKSLQRNRLPLLIIHGTGDDFVPFEMGEANYNATRGPRFMTKVTGAPHVMAYMYDKKLYFEKLDEFYQTLDHQ